MSSGVLGSVRVLDLSSPVGTYCTRLLSDLGADVVLVEPPEGDPYRRLGPFRKGENGPDASLAFGYYQAGKRSIVLDVDDAADLADLEDLGRDADVIVISPSASVIWMIRSSGCSLLARVSSLRTRPRISSRCWPRNAPDNVTYPAGYSSRTRWQAGHRCALAAAGTGIHRQ